MSLADNEQRTKVLQAEEIVDTNLDDLGLGERKQFFFTFGCGQRHENGYVVVLARTNEAARNKMFEVFGNQWSMEYDSAEAAGVNEYKLHLVAAMEA